MTQHFLERHFSLKARIAALRGRHMELEDRIAREQRRPAPDAARLQALKRRRLRIKDEMARFEGVLRLVEAPVGASPTAGST